jgi:alginate O-acetyltransferase complex protein AlgI
VEIISTQFFGFSLLAVFVYHLLPCDFKKFWLLGISFYFYACFDPRFVLVLIVLATTNFLLAKQASKKTSGWLFSSAAILLNIVSFAFLKILASPYRNIFMVGGAWLLPVGFSFYLLQLIRFQLDILRNKTEELPSFVDFLIFLVYFPKLVAGPIEKANVFIQKLRQPLLVTNEILWRSAGLIINGLLRKVVIADMLRSLVPSLFSTGTIPNYFSLLAYGLLLYNDFCGYTSLVRGISLLFGIELSPNFKQPYFARNLSEFWSGWHITLTTWLRETIYFPLARNMAKNRLNKYRWIGMFIPAMITMLISGFWHGVNLGMIFWGSYHGVMLFIEQILYSRMPNLRPTQLGPLGQNVSRLITFVIVFFGWIPFSSNGLQPAMAVLKQLFSDPVIFSKEINVILPIGLIAFSFLMDWGEINRQDELWWQKLHPIVQSFGLVVTGLLILSAGLYLSQEPTATFIYQGF